MIDIENELFTKIATALRTQFSGIFVTGEYVAAPPSFPCAMIVEADNITYRESQTSTENENHATVMYEVNVYSNKTSGRKSEAKAIMAVIDDIMLRLNFDRMFLDAVPNLHDATIYRLTARYIAVISKDEVIYRR